MTTFHSHNRYFIPWRITYATLGVLFPIFLVAAAVHFFGTGNWFTVLGAVYFLITKGSASLRFSSTVIDVRPTVEVTPDSIHAFGCIAAPWSRYRSWPHPIKWDEIKTFTVDPLGNALLYGGGDPDKVIGAIHRVDSYDQHDQLIELIAARLATACPTVTGVDP